MKILSAVDISQGFCLWSNGILEIMVPSDTASETLSSLDSVEIENVEVVISCRNVIASDDEDPPQRPRSRSVRESDRAGEATAQQPAVSWSAADLRRNVLYHHRHVGLRRCQGQLEMGLASKKTKARSLSIYRVQKWCTKDVSPRLARRKIPSTSTSLRKENILPLSSVPITSFDEPCDGDAGTPRAPAHPHVNGILGRKDKNDKSETNGTVEVSAIVVVATLQ